MDTKMRIYRAYSRDVTNVAFIWITFAAYLKRVYRNPMVQ